MILLPSARSIAASRFRSSRSDSESAPRPRARKILLQEISQSGAPNPIRHGVVRREGQITRFSVRIPLTGQAECGKHVLPPKSGSSPTGHRDGVRPGTGTQSRACVDWTLSGSTVVDSRRSRRIRLILVLLRDFSTHSWISGSSKETRQGTLVPARRLDACAP